MKSLAVLLFSALMPVCQAFSLDTATEYWNYTTTSLASTTSAQCRKAYSAEIDCKPFLADLVAAAEDRALLPEYDEETFDNTCTASCHTSVREYIANVQEACSEPGDGALKLVVPKNSKVPLFENEDLEFTTVPVDTIGKLFLYTLMRACAKEDGENCYLTQSAGYAPDYACMFDCATAWYWNRHKYPYYNWHFGLGGNWIKFGKHVNPYNYILAKENFDEKDEGWHYIEKCGLDYKNGSAPFDIGIEGLDSTSLKDTAVTTSTTTASTPSKTPDAVFSSPATSTPTGAAVKRRVDTVGIIGAGIAVVLGLSVFEFI